jgi:translocation and assembly module TamA
VPAGIELFLIWRVVREPPNVSGRRERGLLSKSKLLVLTALTGGILAAPAAAYGQSQPTPTPAPPAQPTDPREPIIPDSQFNEAVPPDEELNRPLEPLDTTPVTPPDGNPATPPRPFPPVPGPVEEDAPLGDEELSQPLPPLDTFNPVPVSTAEAAPEGEELPPIRYTIEVRGLERRDPSEPDLAALFKDLSALEDARGEAVNGAQIEARAREDELLMVRLLHSEGYYDGTATVTVNPTPGADGAISVLVDVTPGQRYAFGEITIAGAEGEAARLARESLLLIKPGEPIVALNVEADEANVLLRLPQNGYPFAQLGAPAEEEGGPRVNVRDILLDPDTHRGDYSLLVDSGPRASFRNVVTAGENQVFELNHIRRLSRFRRDQLFDRRMMDDLREAMVATRLFSSVAAEPVLTDETAPDGTRYVDILIRQEAGPPRSLDANIGYATGEGLRIEGAWEHRRFFRPEGSVRAAAVLGTNEQSVQGRLRFNNWNLRDQVLLFQLEAGRRDFAAFEGYTARLLALVTRESTPIWQKRWTYAYGAEVLATNESQVGAPALNLGDAYFIGGLIGQVGYDRSNSLLNPTEGFRITARLNPEASLRDGSEFYLRSQLDATYYQPFGESFTLAGRARFGSIFGIERDRLAPSRRFYAGGGGSVRGFGYQQLGPRITVANPDFDPAEDDPEEVSPTLSLPVGGRGLTEFAIEGRYRFGNYGIVAFVDAGSVSESEYPSFNDMRFGIGIGGRLYTNFGPIRVDIATPIGRREGESIISLYISIGQAF